QHVRVVPVAGARVGMEVGQDVDDVHDPHPAPALTAVPAVLDVAGAAPEVAHPLRPEPGPGAPPLADAEHDRAAAPSQGTAHLPVGVAGVLALGVAPVVLQVVDSPLRVGARVLLLMALAAGPLLAGAGARVGVEAELEALPVHVVGQ